MKKIIFSFFTVIVIVMTFVTSCKQEDVSSNKLTSNPYDYIGVIHNQGMTKLRDSLLANSSLNLDSYVSKFIGNKIDLNAQPLLLNNINSVISKVKAKNTFNAMKVKSNDSLDVVIKNSNLTEYQKAYMDSVLSILDGDVNIKESILKLESNVLGSNKSEKEKEPILCVISVTKYSIDFWTENLNNSQQAKMFKAPSSCAKLSASTAAKADAGGAITGALASIYSGASTTGLVFGPGGYVLTTAGAAVSGALWSSGLYLVSGGFF